MSFQHGDGRSPRDDARDRFSPDCPMCEEPMWLERIRIKFNATEHISKRLYECRRCGLSEMVVIRQLG